MADQHLAQNAKQSDDTARIRREETLPEKEEEVVQSTVQRAAQALAAPADAEPGGVTALQQVAGNRAVSRLIAPQTAEDDGVVQAKLMVGAPGDKFEREADRVAAKVMNAEVASPVSRPATEDTIQRKDSEKPKFGRSNTFSFSGQPGPKQTRLLNNYVTSKTGKQEKSDTRSRSKFHRTETLGAVFQTVDYKKKTQPAPQSDNKPTTKTSEDTQKPNKKAQGKLPALDKKQLSPEAQKLATLEKGPWEKEPLPKEEKDDEKNQAFAEMEQQEAEQQLDQEQQEALEEEQQEQVDEEQQEQVDTDEEQQEQADTDEEQQVDEDTEDTEDTELEIDIEDAQNLMDEKEELDEPEQSAEAGQEEALDEEALEEEVAESEVEEEEDDFDAEEEQTRDEVTAEENEPDWALSALLEDLEPIGGKPRVQRLTNDVSEYKDDAKTVVKEVVDVEKKDLSDTLTNASKKRAATARVARVEPGIPGLKGVSEDIWLKPLDGLISAQRQPEETGQEQMELTIQRQLATDGSFEVEDKVEQRLTQEKSKGRSLPDDVRTDMESRFGADFSNVRVHTGSEAVQLSENLNAQAFTHGNDIFFNAGKGNFDTADNKRLLAHELTHVIQQMGYGKKDDSSNG